MGLTDLALLSALKVHHLFPFVLLPRVHCARSRIHTHAGQHHSVGRRKCHSAVSLYPPPALSNYMTNVLFMFPRLRFPSHLIHYSSHIRAAACHTVN